MSPVVYLTAYSDNKILERAKRTEPFGYIVKPFDEKDLHSSIEIALHRHRKEKEKNGMIQALRCFMWISSQCLRKNQCGLELKIILSIGNGEEP